MTVIASIVKAGPRSTRVVLRKRGRHSLEEAAAVLRKLHALAGDDVNEHVANYLEAIVRRYSPPVTVRRCRSSGRDRQLPIGDRVEQASKQRNGR